MNADLQKRITTLPIHDQQRQELLALCKYFSENDAKDFLRFLEEKPARAEKLCKIMAQKFKAIRDENLQTWDKALASELALLMQAD